MDITDRRDFRVLASDDRRAFRGSALRAVLYDSLDGNIRSNEAFIWRLNDPYIFVHCGTTCLGGWMHRGAS